MPKTCDRPGCENAVDPGRRRVSVSAEFAADPARRLDFETVYCSLECARDDLGRIAGQRD